VTQNTLNNATEAGLENAPKKQLMALSLAALGVVFGDIATSPIYSMRECFSGDYGIVSSPENIFGILSLIFWSLVIIVGIKYLLFVFRADNRGEGGAMALTALVKDKATNLNAKQRKWFVTLGIFAACLLYGDCMVTPAISVLSAAEGLEQVTSFIKPFIVPITIGILLGLFLIQRHGTAKVGGLFGPIILIWLSFIAVIGFAQILKHPQILAAAIPIYAIKFLITNKLHGFFVLGAVFLSLTGAEALYADMGHFGVKPIRLTWFYIVFPCLLMNYFGQGAHLLLDPGATLHPFFSLIPSWAMLPGVLLATIATVIASQAVISGAFSLTRQAIQLGYLPRLKIVHTSSFQIGQIYIAPVNWMLMICTIGLVLGFQTSSRLAAAYGVAVTSTMLLTTVMYAVITRKRWGWRLTFVIALCSVFALFDIPFFAANMIKVEHGAWFPLLIGALFFLLMITWGKGRTILASQILKLVPTITQFKKRIEDNCPHRVTGEAVFLTGNPDAAPASLIKNIRHNNILHQHTVILHIRTEEIPTVSIREKIEVEKLGKGLYLVIARYGYMETASMKEILHLAHTHGVEVDTKKTSFFLGREKLVIDEKPRMARWRANLFLFMSRNATDAASFFDIPADQVIEVGMQISI
jgi:KUP system potassium uptake protein